MKENQRGRLVTTLQANSRLSIVVSFLYHVFLVAPSQDLLCLLFCRFCFSVLFTPFLSVSHLVVLPFRLSAQVLAPLSTTTIPTENTLSATQLAITSIRKTYLFEFSVAAEASEAYSLVHSCWQAKLKTTSALKERPTKEKEDNEKQTQQPASSHEQQQQQQQSAHHKEGEKAGGDHQHPHHHHTHVQHRVLTKDDWVLLRSGFSSVQSTSVKQNEVVIAEGKPNYRLFQVAAGRCRIETKNKIVGYADEGKGRERQGGRIKREKEESGKPNYRLFQVAAEDFELKRRTRLLDMQMQVR